ncbi:hypothetical protein ACFW9N_32615 [Streptomyces sp. NPDC059496]|uniref:hypothetical protein n=1 Tax=Streptomyces sp. NPDC059496 TaxID=3346851 RepID=UPI0036B7BCAC
MSKHYSSGGIRETRSSSDHGRFPLVRSVDVHSLTRTARLGGRDVGHPVHLLGDLQAFVNEPTEPAHLREESRRCITTVLLIHACRTDDPALVRRLCQVARSEVYRIDLRLLQSEPCLLALFDGLGQEELSIRHAAMRMVGNIHLQTDIAPILDTIIGELASLEHGRGYHRVARAEGARWALVAHSLDTDDLYGWGWADPCGASAPGDGADASG